MNKTFDAAIGRWKGILVALGVDESYLRNRHGPCPMCGGKDRFRFDDKDGRGTWFCNNCGAGNGMDLALNWTGRPFKDTASEIDKLVGVVMPEQPRPKKDPKIRLRKIAQEVGPMQEGDPVWKYLHSRGLGAVAESKPKNIYTHPGIIYYDDGQPRGRYPAMVNIFYKGKTAVTYHVTYLTPEGGKAAVPQCKKVLPPIEPMNGGCVFLGRPTDTIHVAEGIETALAIQQYNGDPCVAVTSAGMMECYEWPSSAKRLMIYADNDENYRGQKAAYTLGNRAAGKGLDVDVVVPPVPGTDYLDVLCPKPGSE